MLCVSAHGGFRCLKQRRRIISAILAPPRSAAHTRSCLPLVQVKIGGRWGTVCGASGFNDAAAGVVCGKLGLSRTGKARPGGSFGPGKLPIMMTAVRCKGGEAELSGCTFSTDTSKCKHGQDVGVVCAREWFALQLGLPRGLMAGVLACWPACLFAAALGLVPTGCGAVFEPGLSLCWCFLQARPLPTWSSRRATTVSLWPICRPWPGSARAGSAATASPRKRRAWHALRPAMPAARCCLQGSQSRHGELAPDAAWSACSSALCACLVRFQVAAPRPSPTAPCHAALRCCSILGYPRQLNRVRCQGNEVDLAACMYQVGTKCVSGKSAAVRCKGECLRPGLATLPPATPRQLGCHSHLWQVLGPSRTASLHPVPRGQADRRPAGGRQGQVPRAAGGALRRALGQRVQRPLSPLILGRSTDCLPPAGLCRRPTRRLWARQDHPYPAGQCVLLHVASQPGKLLLYSWPTGQKVHGTVWQPGLQAEPSGRHLHK